MTQRQLISGGSRIEEIAGFSRAVRVGEFVFVAGTTATDEDGNVVGPDDSGRQTRHILEKIEWALNEANATLADAVRYCVFIVRREDWAPVAVELRAAFSEISPAGTMIVVSEILGEGLLVEIEVQAVVGSSAPAHSSSSAE